MLNYRMGSTEPGQSDEKELQKAIYAYQNRDRRFGGLK